jgi:hypothetical protein
MMLVLLLVLVGLLLDALTDEWGGDGGRLPVFVVDAEKTPAIAEHVQAALAAGHPPGADPREWGTPTRQPAGRLRPLAAGQPAQLRRVPVRLDPGGRPGRQHCGVPRVEQRRQGGALRAFYAKERVRVGDRFLMVVR